MPGTRFHVSNLHTSPPSQLMLGLDNAKFCTYHVHNPQIYEAFKTKAHETIDKGFKHYSAKGIFEIIRWHTGVASNGDCFKVNNNYSSFFARLFEIEYPKYKGFFRNRKSKFD